jgi:hypothetical protein
MASGRTIGIKDEDGGTSSGKLLKGGFSWVDGSWGGEAWEG